MVVIVGVREIEKTSFGFFEKENHKFLHAMITNAHMSFLCGAFYCLAHLLQKLTENSAESRSYKIENQYMALGGYIRYPTTF